MSLHEDVRKAVTGHTSELYFLLEFVRDVDKYITAQGEERMSDFVHSVPHNLIDEVKQFLSDFFEGGDEAGRVLKELVKEPPSKRGKERIVFEREYSSEIGEYIWRFVLAMLMRVRYPEFLYSTALTHSIAVFESFLRDFLIAIFSNRPDTLKSESSATYEDILSFGSMKELIRHLATTRAEKVIKENIDKVADKLREDFNFDVSRFKQFNILREASYRRNVVVHNGGITDKDYCNKIPDVRIGVTLSTDFQYIETLTIVIGQFIERLDKHFARRMHYMRHPKQNSILHPPPR